MDVQQVIDLIADMKREAKTPRQRQICDSAAVHFLTQEVEPMKLASNLDHWLGRNWLANTPPEVMEKLANL